MRRRRVRLKCRLSLLLLVAALGVVAASAGLDGADGSGVTPSFFIVLEVT